jgi:hypothetical protein
MARPSTAVGCPLRRQLPRRRPALRLSVENADNDVLDTENREVEIPDLTAPQLMLGTPSVFRARTARDYQQLKADPEATPTTAREFSRAERVLLRVPLYGAGTATVTARMMNRAAEPIGDLPVTTSSANADMREVELSLAPLPPGEYLVEILAASGAEPVKAVVGFRITS